MYTHQIKIHMKNNHDYYFWFRDNQNLINYIKIMGPNSENRSRARMFVGEN